MPRNRQAQIPIVTVMTFASQEYALCEDPSPEGGERIGFFSAFTSEADDSTDNPGCYGADLVYEHTFTNTTAIDGKAYVRIRPRNVNAKYFGAAQILEPSESYEAVVPPIPVTASLPQWKGVDLTSVYPKPTPDGWIGVPQAVISPGTATLKFTVQNAGGCGTPFNVVLSRLALWPEQILGGE